MTKDIPDTLVKVATNQWELRFLEGGKMVYGIPAGTTSLQPFLLQEVDPWGQALTFGYDANVHLTTITDAQNKVTYLTYDANGHIVQATDPFGRVALFSYDATGNLTQAIDMAGQAFQYTYDADKNITQLNTPQGPWQFYHEGPDDGSRGGSGRYSAPGDGLWESARLTATDPLGAREEYFYYGSPPGFLPTAGVDGPRTWFVDKNHYQPYLSTSVNNGSSNVPKTQFVQGQVIDSKAKITLTSYNDGTQSTTNYDALTGNALSSTDVRGKVTTMTYNALDNPTGVTDAKGHSTAIGYYANGLDVQSVTDALNQNQGTATYNAQHQPLTVTNALSQTTTYTYTSWGAPSTVTDAQGQLTTYYYDSSTRQLLSVTQSTGAGGSNPVSLGSVTYDAQNRVKTSTDAGGQSATYSYDNLDNVTRVDYSDGTFSTTDYLFGGLPGVTTDRSGKKTYYDYDLMKRVTRMQDSNGDSASYGYDKMGQMTKLTDGKNNVTQWAYDDMNRLSSKTYHDGTYESYAYNVPNNTVTFTDTKGQSTTSSYDDVGNLTQSATQNAPAVNLTYDNLDRVYTMADGVGTTTMGYDILSRVTSVDGPFANDTVGYHYDSLGRQDQLQVNAQGSTTDTSAYGYDALSRLKTITNGVGVWNYNYVGNTGRLNTLTAPNTTVATYSYDSLDRLSQVQNKTSGNALISKYAYGYTDVNHKDARNFMERTVGTQGLQHINYSYDNANQLTGESSTETTAIPNVPFVNNTYAYDAMGNRTASVNTSLPSGGNTTTNSASKTHNTLNQLTSQTVVTAVNGTTSSTRSDTYGYDNAGNLNTISNSVDSSGTTYVYDGQNRLINVIQKNAAGTNTTKSEFVYDGMSRKVISREYTWSGSAWALVANSEVRRIYNGMDVVQERDASNNVITKYTRAGNIGGLLSKSVSSNGWSTRYDYFYHYDGSGNVTQMTDVSQATVAEYAYDAYGNTTRMVGTQASANLYRFSTKEYHNASGLYDYGYRFYSPSMGRWINRDPISESGGMNLYAFVGNNPVNYADANGLVRIELRWRYVAGVDMLPLPGVFDDEKEMMGLREDSGNHSFLLVWDTDCKGNKIGVPRYFAGYKGDGFSRGNDLRAKYGYYTLGKQIYPGGWSGAPDYYYQPGHRDYRGSLLITSPKDNCKSSAAVIKRFKTIAAKINAMHLQYPALGAGTNSNSVANTYLQRGLGVDVTSQLGIGKSGLLAWDNLLF